LSRSKRNALRPKDFSAPAIAVFPTPSVMGRGAKFHICVHPMNSSLYEPNFPLLELFQNLSEIMKVERVVEMQTRAA
jgi:hypothetical protein